MKTIILPEELNLNPLSSFLIYNYDSSQEMSKQQILLNQNTFSFLQKGFKEVYFDNSSYSIDNSQFLLMKSGHCLMTEKLSNLDKKYKSILFFFSNEAVFKFIIKYNLNNKGIVTNGSTHSFDYDLFIKRFVDSLIDILKMSISVQKNMLEVKFEEIMLYLIELKGTNFIFSLINKSDNQTQKFIQTIENNYLNKLTLKELSFLSNMSISKFKREFEKHYSESPIKWFQDKRLQHAAYLLKNELKRATDIYEEIGYESLSSFVAAFKIKFGITPKQFKDS